MLEKLQEILEGGRKILEKYEKKSYKYVRKFKKVEVL